MSVNRWMILPAVAAAGAYTISKAHIIVNPMHIPPKRDMSHHYSLDVQIVDLDHQQATSLESTAIVAPVASSPVMEGDKPESPVSLLPQIPVSRKLPDASNTGDSTLKDLTNTPTHSFFQTRNPKTSLHAALLFPVIRARRGNKISIGDGTAQLEAMIAADKPAAEIAKFKAVVRQLQFDIRCHANFTENVPFSVLVIGAAELNGVDVKVVHAFLAVLFVARVCHWKTVSNARNHGAGILRAVGVTLTGFVTLAAAIASALKVFGH
ncbi:hypothetical protein HDU99_001294 [Rhizoclosmatium hyalinum]|nr:hypothetical protein HDU99_001294 [Rhizoclosmatium hyalinum]